MFSIFMLTLVYAGVAMGVGGLIWRWAMNPPVDVEGLEADPESAQNPANSLTVGFRRKGAVRRR
jgi:hypothetical protein